ncbi:MAG: cytochrome ubiquinol oxidase subunit I [candidate division Zixibacteria bacterium]|nr:cytochrome ubiquinol oxidase subunit I [candidate division Zixibacteria bacterium]
MDVLTLSRLQFGLTIAFHYIFPPLSIGLGLILVIMEGLYLKTKNPLYHLMARFWVRIFGLIFAIGVATGIVMEFQFGTNWSAYSRYVGDVFGSALAAEGIFAFFLESGFLAILLFGWNKVSPRFHFFSTIMVALGAHFSAIWIVVANSWQQTPAGHHIVGQGLNARAEIVDFWQMVLNPSSVDRISHTFMGAWQAGAFFILSVSAFYLLRKKHQDFAKTSIKIALIVAAVASVMQLVTGHSSAQGISVTQPAKLAAFEAHYAESAAAPLYLFGWVNEKEEKVLMGVKIPGLLSYLVHGDFERPVTGLRAFPPDKRPPVNFVFQTYHGMVAIGMALIALSLGGLFFWWRRWLFNLKWYLWILVFSVLGPQISNQLGWFSAEVGRQPYIVYNHLLTSEAFSKSISSGEVITSLVMFVVIYIFLLALFVYLLNEKIRQGPSEDGIISEEHRA